MPLVDIGGQLANCRCCALYRCGQPPGHAHTEWQYSMPSSVAVERKTLFFQEDTRYSGLASVIHDHHEPERTLTPSITMASISSVDTDETIRSSYHRAQSIDSHDDAELMDPNREMPGSSSYALHDDGYRGISGYSAVPFPTRHLKSGDDSIDESGGKPQLQSDEDDTIKGDSIRGRKLQRGVFLSWIWELCGVFVSICLLAAIYALLGSFNGKWTSSWKLPINLTTVVALISTANRATLMGIAAAIISQAKWGWFWNSDSNPARRARPLADLQAFENASRGPLGSLLLVRTVLRKPDILLILVVGMLSIAMSPFSQQAILTVECEHVDPAQTAFLPNVHTAGYHWAQAGASYAVKGAVISSLTNPNGSDSTIRATCTTGNCTFPSMRDETSGEEFTHRAISLCSRCVNVSSYISHTSRVDDIHDHLADEQIGTYGITNTWGLPNGQYVQLHHRGELWDHYFVDMRTNDNLSWAMSSIDQEYLRLSSFGFFNVSILLSDSVADARTATICTMFPCTRTYFATINRGELNETAISSNTLTPWTQFFYTIDHRGYNTGEEVEVIFPTDMVDVQTPCRVQDKVYTKYNVSSAPGAQNISRYPSDATSPSIKTTFKGEFVKTVNVSEIIAPAECVFGMEHLSWFSDLQGTLQDAFQGTCSYQSFYDLEVEKPSNAIRCDKFWLERLYESGPYLAGIEEYLEAFALSLTRKLRMGIDRGYKVPEGKRLEDQDKALDDFGENITGVTGVALQMTTCFAVDWRWLLLPSSLTFITAAVLLWTMARGLTTSPDGPRIWKDSLLPLLYHRSRVVPMVSDYGYENRFVDDEEGKNELAELKALERDAKRVRVVFQGS
ncbi:hypothetical protein F4778DRAFT_604590 [Xylariomycetidae sp. FL2044]|nr:hypothetical protein F4778DRAFT_604590 [Xylariomycetidae sp. FL2044]